MRLARYGLMIPVAAVLAASAPAPAEARTKDVVKYGAIALGAAAIYNMGQQSAYNHGGYYYGGPAYYSYPSYSHGYYSYPSYSYYPSYGYYGGYYY
jgi:hypothetical protein